MVTRRGHSLVEMVVALSFLGASLAAITAAAVLSARHTVEAVRLQEATARAAVLLDSLTAGDHPPQGERRTRWGLLRWSAAGSGGGALWIDVLVLGGGGQDTLAVLRGGRIPPPATLPLPRP